MVRLKSDAPSEGPEDSNLGETIANERILVGDRLDFLSTPAYGKDDPAVSRDLAPRHQEMA
jgi:hypothetical protein